MGHIKIAKANGAFDIASADDVIITYSGGTKTTIASTGGALDQDDAQLLINSIDIMDGAAGPAPLVELSETDITVTGAILS